MEKRKSVVGLWVEMHWVSAGGLKQASSAQTESGYTGQSNSQVSQSTVAYEFS